MLTNKGSSENLARMAAPLHHGTKAELISEDVLEGCSSRQSTAASAQLTPARWKGATIRHGVRETAGAVLRP
jgi:hypothetical protein